MKSCPSLAPGKSLYPTQASCTVPLQWGTGTTWASGGAVFPSLGKNLNFCRCHNFSKRVRQESVRLKALQTAFPLLLPRML